MRTPGHRDAPRHFQDCPDAAVPFRGPEDRDNGKHPLKGVPLSRCPENRPTWEIDQDAFDFEERAAIREYDGGLSRPAAERLARLDLIDKLRLKTGDRAA